MVPVDCTTSQCVLSSYEALLKFHNVVLKLFSGQEKRKKGQWKLFYGQEKVRKGNESYPTDKKK